MITYTLNENVTENELSAIRNAIGGESIISLWPAPDAVLPSDIQAAILIIRSQSTDLEEARAIALIGMAVRIVCVYTSEVDEISELAQKYCVTKSSLQGGSLGDALAGNNSVQEKHDGTPAPKNPQKPHRC